MEAQTKIKTSSYKKSLVLQRLDKHGVLLPIHSIDVDGGSDQN